MHKNRIVPGFRQYGVSSGRIESFSDAFIAIIITLMVLEIPLPKSMDVSQMLGFGKSILIYFASFVIVGMQWNRHHRLFGGIKEVSVNFIWKNMIYLFLLSLIPVFMKWLLEFPTSLIPAMAYSVIYILNDVGIRWLFRSLGRENQMAGNEIRQQRQIGRRPPVRPVALFLFFLAGPSLILGLSVFFPEISIVCFIVFPVLMSLGNLAAGDPGNMRIQNH